MENIVRVEHLFKKYKNETILNDLSIQFERGKIYGIVGKNGSGKTVFFKTIAGFVKPTEGKVFVNEKEIGTEDRKSTRLNSSHL